MSLALLEKKIKEQKGKGRRQDLEGGKGLFVIHKFYVNEDMTALIFKGHTENWTPKMSAKKDAPDEMGANEEGQICTTAFAKQFPASLNDFKVMLCALLHATPEEFDKQVELAKLLGEDQPLRGMAVAVDSTIKVTKTNKKRINVFNWKRADNSEELVNKRRAEIDKTDPL